MRILIRPFSSRIFLAPSLLVQLLQNHRARTIIIAALISPVFSGCFVQYGNTNTRSVIRPDSLQQLINSGKFFIVHYADKTTALKHPAITGQELTGESSPVPEEHSALLFDKYDPASILPEGRFSVKKKNKAYAFREVHLYTRAMMGEKIAVAIPIERIHRIDVFSFDEKSTQNNKVISIIGLSLGSVLAIMLLLTLINYEYTM